jgi:hypothetical protein
MCLDDYEDGEIVLQLLCSHIFHGHCVPEWFKKNMSSLQAWSCNWKEWRQLRGCRWIIKRNEKVFFWTWRHHNLTNACIFDYIPYLFIILVWNSVPWYFKSSNNTYWCLMETITIAVIRVYCCINCTYHFSFKHLNIYLGVYFAFKLINILVCKNFNSWSA